MGIGSAALVYAAVTALFFRNLLPDLATHLYSDLGDTLLNASILSWNARQLPLTDAWWNFPGYTPLQGVTSFTEHLLLTYPIASPIIWATGNPILAYNVLFLLAPVLNGVAMYALVRELTQSRVASLMAGLAFAFAPYQAVQLSHIQQMTSFGMPIALLGLHRYLGRAAPDSAQANPPGPGTGQERSRRERHALALFGVGWFVTALSNAYTLMFFPVLVALWCTWFVRPREWRRLVPVAITAVVVVLPLAPLLWGYHVRHAAYGLVRGFTEIRSFSADIVGLGGMYFRSMAWRGILPHDFEEGALFPGFTIAALAGFAVYASRADLARCGADLHGPRRRWSRRLLVTSAVLTLIVLARVWTGPWGWHFGRIPLPPFQPMRLFTVAFVTCLAGLVATATARRAWQRRDPVMFYAIAVVVLGLLALGPEPAWEQPWRALWFGPYRLLMELPGFDSVRVPARTWLLAVLCLAVLAGCGVATMLQRYVRHRRILVAAIAMAIVCEGWTYDQTYLVPRPMRPGVIPQGAVVLDLPMEEGYWNAVPQYRGVVGHYRTINGYSGYEPAHFTPLRRALADMVPGALDSYRRGSDLYVIIRPGQTADVTRWLTSQDGTEHLFDVDQVRIYRMGRLPQ